RPAPVRGRPARVRRQAGSRPGAPARRPARHAAGARPQRAGCGRGRRGARSARARRHRRPRRAARSRHGGLPAAAHRARVLPARRAAAGARRAPARARGLRPGRLRLEPRHHGARATGAAHAVVALQRGGRVRTRVVRPAARAGTAARARRAARPLPDGRGGGRAGPRPPRDARRALRRRARGGPAARPGAALLLRRGRRPRPRRGARRPAIPHRAVLLRSPVFMLSVLRGVRSLLSVLLVGLLFMLMSLPLRLVVVPGSFLFPSQRFRLVSLFMKTIVHGIWTALRLGGARARRVGRIPTDEPVLVVANHQSLTDILQLTLLATPFTPAFVTRRRYQRYVPLVSASMRLLGCPIVDPRRDPHGSVAAIRRGARELPHGIFIFPEGHRSRDGEVLPFRIAGAETILSERRVPVYVVVNDGAWRVGR